MVGVFVEVLENIFHFENLLVVGLHLAFELVHHLNRPIDYSLQINLFALIVLIAKMLNNKK